MPSRSIVLAGLCGAAFVLSLGSLGAGFLASMARAERLFDRAAAAEAQRVYVSQIETLARTGDRGGLIAMLGRYRSSIVAEAAISPTDFESREAQHREAHAADRLRSLALDGDMGTHAPLSTLIGEITERERQEAAALARDMQRLRARTAWQAVLLALLAGMAGIIGALGLFAANRRLSGEVARRTAEIAGIDRSRRLFFAKASHELRTPITVMRGEAEVALAGVPSIDALREALAHVVANAEFLDHRVEELLGLARADSGRIELRMERVDLGAIVEAASEAARGYACSAAVGLEVGRVGCPLPVAADRRWLGQALLAVIDNGVKFSSSGGTVTLRASREPATASVTIIDRGIGVAPPDLPRVFDAYYQAEDGQARGGSGLGLALARWVVEQHHGSIAASPTPGGGCTVTITLPIAA